ncbi:hypothetical protein MED92_12244 [Oceanospirillum sp. MED92]|uniref:Uncharacterized protein n=1 Tax=Neptuniibacter caesariensis TaxID=207954 RepID=A0A7U8C117_NEPCE|nr:hypothetical protein MED92_12244 [Oceanospirillum sp. MED92] [Neptuniibacter caesariensis]
MLGMDNGTTKNNDLFKGEQRE